MSGKPALTQLLKVNASISEQAAAAYKHILIVGSLTIGEVCEYTGLDYDTVDKALKELVDGRLIRRLTHVVDRYIAVAPYRAFAEHLVEFQRTAKEMAENAKKSIHSTLEEISKTNRELKTNAAKLKDEEVSQAKKEVADQKEQAANAGNGLVEKLRNEIDALKSSLNDSVRRQIEEHSTKISEAKDATTYLMDNSVTRFAETIGKSKEEATQTTVVYLGRFDEKIQSFLSTVRNGLGGFQSSVFSSIERFQSEATSFLEDSRTKIGVLTEGVKTKNNDAIRELSQAFGQLSNELESSISSHVDSAIGTISSKSNELGSKLAGALQTYGVELGETVSGFGSRFLQTLGEWKSGYESELTSEFNVLRDMVSMYSQDLTKRLESTNVPMSDILKAYISSTENASNEFGSNLGTLFESFKKDLGTKTSPVGEELQESCDLIAKDCSSLATTIESLSKKHVPLATRTMTSITSELSTRVSKMIKAVSEESSSFADDIEDKVLKALGATEKARSRTELAEGQRGFEALRKEVSRRIGEATKTYAVSIREGTGDLEKYVSDRLSATSKFEEDLENKWETIKETTGKAMRLSENVKSYPAKITETVKQMVEQNGEKLDSVLSSTKRLVSVHSKSLADGVTSALKKWGATIDKTEKEMDDLVEKRQGDLTELISKHNGNMEKVASEYTAELAGLVRATLDSYKSESQSTHLTISDSVGSITQSNRTSLKELESKLKTLLKASVQSFTGKVETRCRENDSLSARIVDETARSVGVLKEQLDTMVDESSNKFKRLCEEVSREFDAIVVEQSKALHEVVSSLTTSFNAIADATSEEYRKESLSTKDSILLLLTQNSEHYSEMMRRTASEIEETLSRHFNDFSEMTKSLVDAIDNLLAKHDKAYEEAYNLMIDAVNDSVDKEEADVRGISTKMLNDFTNNTSRIGNEANSVESLMRTAWAEITDTQQTNADKTWHYVTKQAILNHVRDMVKRTKSTVTIVVPSIEEAPLEEVRRISKAIRVQIVAGVDEMLHKNLLRGMLAQGNVRIWALSERNYISCTRDAEEVLIAPVAPKDIDCIATVSVEEGFIKLIMKIVGPMWLAASRMVSLASLNA